MDLVGYYAERERDMLEMLRQLVALESPSTDKPAVDRLGGHVAELAREAGAQVSVQPGGRYGDHLVCRWGQGEDGILLLAHLDTVWGVGTLAQRPWRVSEGRAYGPGCLDDKAGVIVALGALGGLAALGRLPQRPICLLLNSDEEVGSRSSRSLIEAEARRAVVVFCLEPALPTGGLKVWRKGTGRYVVTAHGRSAHSGSDHAKGINAILELAEQIVRLQAMTDYEVGSTVNVGWVHGGTRTNVVPDHAEARVDLRVQTASEASRMDAAIRALRPALPGARLTVTGGLSRPPMEATPTTLEPFQRAQAIGCQLGLALEAGGSGGASDANFTAALGVPTLDGLGAVGDGAHSLDEYVVVSSLPERAALLAALLTNW